MGDYGRATAVLIQEMVEFYREYRKEIRMVLGLILWLFFWIGVALAIALIIPDEGWGLAVSVPAGIICILIGIAGLFFGVAVMGTAERLDEEEDDE